MTISEVRNRLLDGDSLDRIFPLRQGQECEIYKATRFCVEEPETVVYIPDFDLNDLYRRPLTEEYISDQLHCCFTVQDFIDEAGGDPVLAERLFWYCDWQHPSSAIDEVRDEIEAGETYVFDTHGGDSTWNERSGQRCVAVRPLTRQECDIDDVGPMWRVRFEDGIETDAFQDELKEE